MTEFYRVEDDQGRGPFKPGLSRYWVREDRDHEMLPPWYEVVPVAQVLRQLRKGERAGSACESKDDLARWFSQGELNLLMRMGYRVVEFRPVRVLYRLKHQCVVVLPRRRR